MTPQEDARLLQWIQENLDRFQQVDVVDEPAVDEPVIRLLIPGPPGNRPAIVRCVEASVQLSEGGQATNSPPVDFPKLYIVIPARNEQDVIVDMLRSIERAVDLDHEIIVVNDHSTDRTEQVVRAFAEEHGNVRLINNRGKNGFSNALQVGYQAAGDGVSATMMADLCDDPSTLKLMYQKIQAGFDIVCGSRYVETGRKLDEDSQIKGLLSRFVGLSLRRLVGVPTHDATNAFKMYRSQVLKSIHIEEAGFACSMEITVKAFLKGYKITEVPTTWRGRTVGTSKFSMFKAGKDYLRWYIWAALLRKHTF